MRNHLLLTVAALTMTVSAIPALAQDAIKKPAPAAAASGRIDTNNDGAISKTEADAIAVRDFTSFDTDKNGKVSFEEFKSLIFKANAGKLTTDAAKKNAEAGLKGQFDFLDLNKDGNVTKAEMQEDSTKRFKIMDENGDGKVTKEEAADIQKKMRAKIEQARAAKAKKTAPVAPPADKK